MSDDLVVRLRHAWDERERQLGEDEQWARAASQAYTYAVGDRAVPAEGVHWTWVAGENWEPVRPDPAIDEFVAPPGENCNLATIEQWSIGNYGIEGLPDRLMPQTYANSIVEMDASAAGHIARHDPARVLAEVERGRRDIAAKRHILDEYEQAQAYYEQHRAAPAGEVTGLWTAVRALAEAEGLA